MRILIVPRVLHQIPFSHNKLIGNKIPNLIFKQLFTNDDEFQYVDKLENIKHVCLILENKYSFYSKNVSCYNFIIWKSRQVSFVRFIKKKIKIVSLVTTAKDGALFSSIIINIVCYVNIYFLWIKTYKLH